MIATRRGRQDGFTLLEVIIALGVLAVGLMVLVDSQSTAVLMSLESDEITVATMLAEEKMMEAQLIVETEGFGESDIEEDGDFTEFGNEQFRGESLHLDLGEDLDDYRWAYTIRKIDLTIPTDVGGVADQLAGTGYFPEEKTEQMDTTSGFDLTDIGITPDMLTDYLGNFVREVRVLVWWGENEDGVDQVELTSHVINPTGAITEAESRGLSGSGSSSSSSDSGGSSNSNGSGSSRGSRGSGGPKVLR